MLIFDKRDSFFGWADSADKSGHYVMGWQLIWWWWSSILIYCFHIFEWKTWHSKENYHRKLFPHILWKNQTKMTAQNMSNDFNPCITFQWNVIVRNTVYFIVFLQFMFQVLQDLFQTGTGWTVQYLLFLQCNLWSLYVNKTECDIEFDIM